MKIIATVYRQPDWPPGTSLILLAGLENESSIDLNTARELLRVPAYEAGERSGYGEGSMEGSYGEAEGQHGYGEAPYGLSPYGLGGLKPLILEADLPLVDLCAQVPVGIIVDDCAEGIGNRSLVVEGLLEGADAPLPVPGQPQVINQVNPNEAKLTWSASPSFS